MKSILALLFLTACSNEVQSFDIDTLDRPASPIVIEPNASPHQAPDDRLQCVEPGIYTIQFLPSSQAEENGSCDGIASPTIATLDITDQVSFLGCAMELDNETCTFNAIDPTCQPLFDNASYGWNGRITFGDVHLYVPVEVGGRQLYEVIDGFYGIGSITVRGLCTYGVFFSKQTDT